MRASVCYTGVPGVRLEHHAQTDLRLLQEATALAVVITVAADARAVASALVRQWCQPLFETDQTSIRLEGVAQGHAVVKGR